MSWLNPICVALDTSDLARAAALTAELRPHAGLIKIGMEFFYAHGPAGYERIADLGIPVFLDLKLHDIPNTVAAALRALMRLSPAPAIVNLHAAGGGAMMAAARDAIEGKTKLIAVTILTSLSGDDLEAIGFDPTHGTAEHAQALARLAKMAGLDGVVCSADDLAAIRSVAAPPFLTVVPGIRPHGAASADQKRISSPAAALAAGADILVIGRPITEAGDPAAAAAEILQSLHRPEAPPAVQVKICGLSTSATLTAALDAGADYVGLVFYGPSPRNVSLERASALAGIARGRARIVALTVDAADEQILAIRESVAPDLYQLHGAETPEHVARVAALTGKPVIKALKVKDKTDIAAARAYAAHAAIVLFDAKVPETLAGALPGGNGVAFDWALLDRRNGPAGYMLSGGLHPGNVAAAIRQTGARLVDVSSGVESAPGIKDVTLIRNFIETAKAAR